MIFYDREGYPIDLGSMTVEQLNAVVREGIDMIRLQLTESSDPRLAGSVAALHDSAVRFTNSYYGPLRKSP